jgi:hypothetical protein
MCFGSEPSRTQHTAHIYCYRILRILPVRFKLFRSTGAPRGSNSLVIAGQLRDNMGTNTDVEVVYFVSRTR